MMPTILTQLREILIDHFDQEELKTLCFDLGIDYESLPGSGKANKARDLISALQRQGRLSELITFGQQERPHIQWPSLLETSAKSAMSGHAKPDKKAVPSAATSAVHDWSRLRRFLPVELFEQVENSSLAEQQALCLPHLQQLLATIVTYVPRHRALTLLANPIPPDQQHDGIFLEGTLLFADISGFTELTERALQMGGKEGAEKIVEFVNHYLDTMLAILFQYHGRLIKFGGDAMLCLFTGEEAGARNALWTAWEMNQTMAKEFTQVQIFQELFNLNMKVGHSSGLLFAATVGDSSHLEYVLTGSAVERTAQAEAAAHRGEIIVSQETYDQVADWVEAEKLPEAQGLYRVTAVPPQHDFVNGENWSTMFDLFAQTTDLFQVVTQLEALAPYLPLGLLPQLVYDPQAKRLESQHRRVTILFANFLGMSRIVETFGVEKVEEITAVLQEYFQGMQEEIHYYGGVTNKVDLYNQGDKLMVIFGAPIAREKDVSRAALTALAMQRRMRQLVSPFASIFLSQRIGIHTGFVFAGNVGSASQQRREYTVMGNTVNLAARLMSAARENQIWISPATWQQIQTEFKAEPLDSITAKGFRDPITPYRLELFLDEQKDVHRFLQAPLVGRHQELNKLLTWTDDMLYGGGKQIVAVTGEGGVGKSRLVRSWQEQVDGKTSSAPLWLISHAHSYGQNTNGLFLDILKRLLGITSEDSQMACWRKLDSYLGQNLVGTAFDIANQLLQQEAFLGSFLGLDLSLRRGTAERVSQLEGEALQLQIRLTITNLLAAAAAMQPLILVLEDLHWADEGSLGLLKFLIDRLPDTTSIIFCLVYRSRKELPVWQIWRDLRREHPDCEELALGELDGASRAMLLHQLLNLSQPLDSAFEQMVLDETDGNPLYLEEVLYRLIADKVLVETEGGWQLSQPITELAVPDTLYQMIQSRIDDLDYASPGARRVLWLAAVSGLSFTSEGLEYLFLNNGREQDEFQRHFRVLRNAAMFERTRIQLANDNRPGFKFRHGLVQQVAYENMPTTHSRQYHRQVGEWLESSYEAALMAHYEILAHHFSQGQVWDKAFHYYFLAGQRDAHVYDNENAYRHLWLALSLVEEAKPDQSILAQAYYEFGRVLITMGEFDEALVHLGRAFELLSSLGEALGIWLQARVCYEIGRIHELLGQASLPEALVWQERGLALLPDTPTAEAALLHVLGGIANLRLGNWARLAQESQAALAIAQAIDAPQELSAAHRMMSVYWRVRGDLVQAMVHCQQGVAISQEQGDLLGLIKGIANQGVIAFEMDDWPQAQASYLESITLLDRVGDRYELGRTHLNLGDLYAHLGDIEAGLRHTHQGLEIAQALQSTQEILIGRVILAMLHWRQAEFAEALAQLGEAEKLATTAVMFQPTVGRWLAQVYLTQGNLTQAENQLQTLLTLDENILDDEVEPIQCLQAQLLAAQGQQEAAIALLEASLARLDGMKYQQAQALLALAQILAVGQRTTEARRSAQTAQAIFTELGASLDVVATNGLLAQLATES